jgi:hypothetical protein
MAILFVSNTYVVIRRAQKHGGLHLDRLKAANEKTFACLGKGLADNVEVAC